MSRNASKIRSINKQINYFGDLMVAAMSGKAVEFRRPAPKLHKEQVILPALGRLIKVVKKINLGQEVSRQKTHQAIESLRLHSVTEVVRNHQRGGSRVQINKYHPLGDERLSSKEMGKVDHKRQKRRPKGSARIQDVDYNDPFVSHYEFVESLVVELDY